MPDCRLSVSVALVVLGLGSSTVLASAHLPAQVTAALHGITQDSERAPKGPGIIAGVVVDERKQPVVRATVQVFSVESTFRQAHVRGAAPALERASGTASTDAEGRFRISGLPLRKYLIAAAKEPSLPSGESATQIYGTTFYPSTIDDRQALSVSASADPATTVQIELVPVRGARVSGLVVSPSGRPTSGLSVRLFERFGDFGSESPVAVVNAQGTFETPRLRPGWYRLTIGPPVSHPADDGGEFADKLIEVQDRDIQGLSLVLGPGASISGRVVVEPGASVPTPVGLRVNASPTPEQYSAQRSIAATVAGDWSFRMTGLSNSYQFTVSADRPPALVATRVTVDGVQVPEGAGVELVRGAHEAVVFVAPRESPRPKVVTSSSGVLLEQFRSEKVFWRQIVIAKEIVDRHDASVLPSLAGWLSHEDRHLRGNVAFIFAGLGDPRGFDTIVDILNDRSDRPEGQGIAMASSDGRYHVARQIAADRYYAAHLLGDLRDPLGVPVLVPLLKDAEVQSIVPWALGEIGDKRAIGPLLDALDDDSPTMRVLAIYALETLHAREALPRLISLLNDDRKSNFGAAVSVADAARAAIAKLQ